MKITNSVAIITGGTGGLGRHIVNKFAERGMKIYVPVRLMREFDEIFNRKQFPDEFRLLKIYAMECDANDNKQVEEFVSNVVKLAGRIDFLINTVGGYYPKKLLVDTDEDLIIQQMNLNLLSTFRFTKNCLKYMSVQKYGRIISIGAKPAIEITTGKFAYGFTKSGVVQLMKYVNAEHEADDIKAWTLIPTIIDTPANRLSMPNADFSKWLKPETIAEKCLEIIGMEKVGEDVILL